MPDFDIVYDDVAVEQEPKLLLVRRPEGLCKVPIPWLRAADQRSRWITTYIMSEVSDPLNRMCNSRSRWMSGVSNP
jgi:hypothetical protein